MQSATTASENAGFSTIDELPHSLCPAAVESDRLTETAGRPNITHREVIAAARSIYEKMRELEIEIERLFRESPATPAQRERLDQLRRDLQQITPRVAYDNSSRYLGVIHISKKNHGEPVILEETIPSFQGTGQAGEERRRGDYGVVPYTNFYVVSPTSWIEECFAGGAVHLAIVEKSRLYDMRQGYLPAERLRELGFSGAYFFNHYGLNGEEQVWLWEPHPVTYAGKLCPFSGRFVSGENIGDFVSPLSESSRE